MEIVLNPLKILVFILLACMAGIAVGHAILKLPRLLKYRWVQRLGDTLRWLHDHWEWYFVAITALYVVYLLTHVQNTQYLYFGLLILLMPSPMVWAFIIAIVQRVQIGLRIYGWFGYAFILTLVIGVEPSGETLSKIYHLRMEEFEEPLLGILMYSIVLFCPPFVLFWWTRQARLHPQTSKWDASPMK